MPKIASIREISAKYHSSINSSSFIRNVIIAYLEGRQSERWTIGVLRSRDLNLILRILDSERNRNLPRVRVLEEELLK